MAQLVLHLQWEPHSDLQPHFVPHCVPHWEAHEILLQPEAVPLQIPWDPRQEDPQAVFVQDVAVPLQKIPFLPRHEEPHPFPQEPFLVEQVVAQPDCPQELYFSPVLQPVKVTNNTRVVGTRAIHRLRAIIASIPCERSSRQSLQKMHGGANRAKTGNW